MNENDVYESIISDLKKNHLTVNIEKIKKDVVESDTEIRQLESEIEYLNGIKSIFEN